MCILLSVCMYRYASVNLALVFQFIYIVIIQCNYSIHHLQVHMYACDLHTACAFCKWELVYECDVNCMQL